MQAIGISYTSWRQKGEAKRMLTRHDDFDEPRSIFDVHRELSIKGFRRRRNDSSCSMRYTKICKGCLTTALICLE